MPNLLLAFLALAHAAPPPVAGAPAATTAPARAIPARATPTTALAAYFSPADYPPSALGRREQGITRFYLAVGPNGRVTDCRVTAGSGSPALDDATCRILRSRARFRP